MSTTISVNNKLNVDIPKLKSEIEASGKYKVALIRETTTSTIVFVSYADQHQNTLSTQDQSEVISIINNHSTEFRRKVLVQELPDDTAYDDAAVNKKYIDNLVGGAPGYLDTLKELSDAIGASSENDLAPSILSKIASLRTDLSDTQNDLDQTQISLASTQTALTQEINRATLAETTLQNNIDNLFIPLSLDDLSDVWVENKILGELIVYDGTTFINTTVLPADLTINGITVGSKNDNTSVAIGNGAFSLSVGSGHYSTAIGYKALSKGGNANVAIGANAGENSTGSSNVYIGEYAAQGATSGGGNVVIGETAAVVLGSSYNNTIVGYEAGQSLSNNAQQNVMIGAGSGVGLNAGSNNVFIGNYQAYDAPVVAGKRTLNNNIIIADGQGNIRFKSDGSGNVTVGSKLTVTPTAVETVYNSTTSKETNSTATTTDATTTTLYSLTLVDNTAYTFDVNIIARASVSGTTKVLTSKIMFGAHKDAGGSATLANNYGGPIIQLDTTNSPTYDVSVDVNGSDVRIQVTGAASETVKWAANVRHVQIS